MVANPHVVKGIIIFSVLLLFGLASVVVAQYDHYHFRAFPKDELMPLESAYGQALDHYAAENWTDCIKYMELSLRLHRLLRDSVTYCVRHCNKKRPEPEGDSVVADGDLQVSWRVVMRASCLEKCSTHFPALSLPFPKKKITDDFERRLPYRYMYFAHFQKDEIHQAVSCAHTYLQKNPEDPLMTQHMDHYKSQFDLEGYLIDQEERPYEGSFLKAVNLFGSGDFGSSVGLMERALGQYLQEYELCQAGCEGASEVPLIKDLYPTIADAYVEALKCKVKCEENLMPNVGGFFVEKFMATMYHYLQFSYYKLNEARSAAPCASSYGLFDPEDVVMKENMLYYRSYQEQWGLEDRHFTPRTEALRYYNQTTTQKQMLALAENYLQSDNEDFSGPEEAGGSTDAEDSPDVEFEGVGDYEESFNAKWWQPEGKGDTANSG